jgi:hypothetical protein
VEADDTKLVVLVRREHGVRDDSDGEVSRNEQDLSGECVVHLERIARGF